MSVMEISNTRLCGDVPWPICRSLEREPLCKSLAFVGAHRGLKSIRASSPASAMRRLFTALGISLALLDERCLGSASKWFTFLAHGLGVAGGFEQRRNGGAMIQL
jgi:hypothetical protein